MYRTPTTDADEALRTATAAHTERARLIKLRDDLVPDMERAEGRVATFAAKLDDEQKDVRRYESGVWAFLYDIFADRQARLTKEQREAAEAQARHAESLALRDRLREELASLAARIDSLASAEADLAAARAGKQAVLVASGGPAAQELLALTNQLAAVEAEVRELDEALAAGDRAHKTLTKLAEVLASARNWGVADILSDSFFISWAKRGRLDEAQSIAGVAQAELTVFRRELGDVGVALASQLDALANHHRFLDTWFDNIFSDWSVQNRIESAQMSTVNALEQVTTVMSALWSRRTTAITLGEQFSKQRLELLER